MKKKRILMVGGIILLLLAAIASAFFFFLRKEDSYAMKVNDVSISPQVYQAYLIQKTLLAKKSVPDGEADLWNQKIEEMPVSDWVQAKAREQIVYDTIVKEEWDKEKISVSQSDQERLTTYLGQQWEVNQAVYKENKGEREAFNAAYQSFLYTDLLFDQYTKEHPTEKKTAQTQVATAKYFLINKYGLEGNLFTKEQVSECLKLAGGYVKQLKKKKTIDQVYQSYQKQLGEELVDNRPLTASVITADSTEYNSKIPKFVAALMEAKIEEPFYTQDDYYITVGIRQEDTNNKTVQQAYAAQEEKKIQQESFNRYLDSLIQKARTKVNETWMKHNPPESITLVKDNGGDYE